MKKDKTPHRVVSEVGANERAVVFRDLVPEIPSTTYATFGLYRYPAKFIPQVIAYALKTYARAGESVFDPSLRVRPKRDGSTHGGWQHALE